MNLRFVIELQAGGVGSGCHGSNCGRKALTDKQRQALDLVPKHHLKGVQDKFIKVVKIGDIHHMGYAGTAMYLADIANNDKIHPGKVGKDSEILVTHSTSPHDLLHEVGHHVWYTQLNDKQRENWINAPVAVRGKTYTLHGNQSSAVEHFAEAYAHALRGTSAAPERISRERNEKYKFYKPSVIDSAERVVKNIKKLVL